MRNFPITPLLVIGALTIAIVGCEKTVTEGPRTPTSETPQIGFMKATNTMFTGDEDHAIPLETADQMIVAFQNNNPYNTYAWYFSKKAIEQLLAYDGAVGIRIYGGLDQASQFSPVLFGVTPDGKDLVSGGLSKATSDSTGGGAMEEAMPCPPFCDPEP